MIKTLLFYFFFPVIFKVWWKIFTHRSLNCLESLDIIYILAENKNWIFSNEVRFCMVSLWGENVALYVWELKVKVCQKLNCLALLFFSYLRFPLWITFPHSQLYCWASSCLLYLISHSDRFRNGHVYLYQSELLGFVFGFFRNPRIQSSFSHQSDLCGDVSFRMFVESQGMLHWTNMNLTNNIWLSLCLHLECFFLICNEVSPVILKIWGNSNGHLLLEVIIFRVLPSRICN